MAFLQRMAAVGRALPRQARGVAAEALREPPPLGVTFREVNKCEFKIIDSTLREGEQFDTCTFNTHDRIYIAKMLDKLGVDYIEMLNPVASQQAFEDCRTLADLDMQRAKILTHIRCDMRDVEAAVESGVHGVNMYMATSEILVQHSHKKGIDEVLRLAEKAITYVKKHGLECRFSCEDTFRSNMNDVLKVYTGVAEMGVDRVGIADTVGIATPLDAYRVVGTVKAALPEGVGIEFHAHDDTGCCLANALMAVEAGATHIDTCVLGIGERNGIVNLGGLLARMYTLNKEKTLERFNLHYLPSLDKYVATAAQVQVPFNNYVTGSGAFTHKAGVHTKAVMSNPGAYEILNPEDFGVQRRVNITNRITGWNAIKARAKQLQLDIADEQIQIATQLIKNLSDSQKISNEQVDAVLISIAAGPRVNTADFIKWGAETEVPQELQMAAQSAASAIRQYQEQLARAAIAKIPQPQDTRPFRILRLTGHLFDKEVLNRTMDICVDSPCDFDLLNVKCAKKNELESFAELKLMCKEESDLRETIQMMHNLIDGLEEAGIARCSLTDITEEYLEGPAMR